MDRGVWWATVHGVAKSWTRLSNFCVCIPSEGWHGLIKDALERECGASKKDKGDFFFFNKQLFFAFYLILFFIFLAQPHDHVES